MPDLEGERHPLIALQLGALLVTLQLLVLPHQLLRNSPHLQPFTNASQSSFQKYISFRPYCKQCDCVVDKVHTDLGDMGR